MRFTTDKAALAETTRAVPSLAHARTGVEAMLTLRLTLRHGEGPLFAAVGGMVIRRARKAHQCRTTKGGTLRGWDAGELPAGHTPEILPGAQYVEYLGEAAAYASGVRYCAACMVAAGVALEQSSLCDPPNAGPQTAQERPTVADPSLAMAQRRDAHDSVTGAPEWAVGRVQLAGYPATGTVVMYSDGGRRAAGYRGPARDCVCRAVAIVTGMPYDDAYDGINQCSTTELTRRGRVGEKARTGRGSSARTGVYKPTVRAYLKSLGFVWTPTMRVGDGCRVHLRADELPAGRLIVAVSRHLVAMIDGVIYDTHDSTREGTRCVYGYWTWPYRPRGISSPCLPTLARSV